MAFEQLHVIQGVLDQVGIGWGVVRGGHHEKSQHKGWLVGVV
jgi:hypothetical protein